MQIAWKIGGLLGFAALALWFFACVLDGWRTGQVRPVFRKQPYTRKKHPWAFAAILLEWILWGLICLYPAVLCGQDLVRAISPAN